MAKNYLNADELKAMGQIVEGYLAFAERQAQREEYMTMQDWATHLDHILTTTGEKLLQNAGSISHRQAIEKAHSEYRLYQARTLSGVEYDFMETIKELEHKIK